jgi:hypothetical protein
MFRPAAHKLCSMTDMVRVVEEWEAGRATKVADRLVGSSQPEA